MWNRLATIATALISIANVLARRPIADVQSCPAVTIANSNRSAADSACVGLLGDQCYYKCDAGYLQIGRHVCQEYSAGGTTFINRTFFGGRCERLCALGTQSCNDGTVPVRIPAADTSGSCLSTTCMSADDALRNLARGNYEVWRRSRFPTGIYVDTVHLPTMPNETAAQGRASMTGVGMMFEIVAEKMGWISRDEAQARILQSLGALNGDVKIDRTAQGFYTSFFDAATGSSGEANVSGCMMCTGLMMGGVNFVRNYYESVDPLSANTQQISKLAASIFHSIRWYDVLCNENMQIDAVTGQGLPMLEYSDGRCKAVQFPQADGAYNFNEEHYTFWFASMSNPYNVPLTNMWARWMQRRLIPNQRYKDHDLLSMWSGYIVHLPFYTTASFNSDETFTELFRNHWLADWQYYNDTTFAGERGRYGLGAGPTPQWCTAGSGYHADQIGDGSSHCRTISPYIIAGYLPAAPEVIRSQILDLLADGETVYPVPSSPFYILWRKSMLDTSWQGGYGITTVDFSSELFGLSTLWLGMDFYRNYTQFHEYPGIVV
eukprot:TRINITY_DN34509_c0_g1_i1.p1 TRINITY_DN34509_c0_g1~~TRINITY_DN34509_c0_g1_i1.p1  ORF type:complete len:548 (-),score=56.57 TRINITY_DN34509_c0_g1_i1:50-1693(-)